MCLEKTSQLGGELEQKEIQYAIFVLASGGRPSERSRDWWFGLSFRLWLRSFRDPVFWAALGVGRAAYAVVSCVHVSGPRLVLVAFFRVSRRFRFNWPAMDFLKPLKFYGAPFGHGFFAPFLVVEWCEWP